MAIPQDPKDLRIGPGQPRLDSLGGAPESPPTNLPRLGESRDVEESAKRPLRALAAGSETEAEESRRGLVGEK